MDGWKTTFLLGRPIFKGGYHELVKSRDGEYHFGRFFPGHSARRGGFIPILWDAPKSDTYAVQDIGMVVDHIRECFKFSAVPEDSLAVLHNKNRLVHAFGRSGWVHDGMGEVVSRSVPLPMVWSGKKEVPLVVQGSLV